MHAYLELMVSAFDEFADNIAVVDREGERSTSYRDFGQMVRKAAAWFLEKKLPPHSFVPVLMPSGMEYAATVIGLWLSGNVAVPMGPSFPPERVEYIRMHCEAPLIAREDILAEFAEREPAGDEDFVEVSDDDVAFLLYTSGSTGSPKGILHTFGSLLFNAEIGQKYSPKMIFGMGAPMYFVASLAIYKCFRCGSRVVLISEEANRDVRKLEDFLEKHSVTATFISPAVLSNFRNRSSALKLVFTGSERLTGQCSRDGYRLYNNYGMSETAGTMAAFLVEQPYETTPVGVPKEPIQWKLIGEDGKEVQKGEVGEFCAKGVFTKGYFKDPEQTAKLYDEDGWLHTNDLLKELPDGNLVYINRKDWMVKINGQRVEPGEIENVLRKVEGVSAAVVKPFTLSGGQTALCGYYVSPEPLDEEYLKEKLSEKLASYMVPAVYLHMDRFPLNANGKVDRKNLPAPNLLENRAEFVAPENETQAALCRAFAEILDIDRIGIDDDFFTLGGDSIRVMKLAASCPELMLTTKLIYAEKTPRRIAAACGDAGQMKPREKKESYPLSASQLGIYVASIQRDGEAAYNNPLLLRMGANTDTELLARAAEAAVAAHPFVKTRIFLDENGDPRQRRMDEEPFTLGVENVSEDEFKRIMPTLMQPFRVLKDRLFRIRIFKTESNVYLFFDFHHIIFDGSSMLVLLDDLQKAYRGQTLYAETYSGFELAEDEALAKAGTAYEEAKTWYLENFGKIEGDFLPVPDRKEPAPRFGSLESDYCMDTSEVEDFCRTVGISENILATSAFAIAAAAFAGTNEALFATIYNGRDSLKTARTVGMLVKTLPVYASFSANDSSREFLLRQKEQMLGCMNRDIYPFSELAAANGMTSDLLFAYQGDFMRVGEFSGQAMERIPLMENATGEKLTVQLYKNKTGYHVRAEYHANLYSEELIGNFLESYGVILRGLTQAETMGDIPLASSRQMQILNSWNATEVPYDASETVVSLFRKAAARFPENTAVIYGDGKWTYREIDGRSEAVAAFLASRGIGRGDVVSVLIPRGEYQAIASLGALKAGCGYQPLDATYPDERLSFMVEDASARLLITTEELREKISGYEGETLYLSEVEKLPEAAGEAAAAPCPEDLFVLLYTSGSTGTPKGVRLTHGNLISFIDWYRRYYDLTKKDVVGQYASYGFDACMMDMYPALCYGASVCIVPEELRLDITGMHSYLCERKTSLVFFTTQVGRQYADEFDTDPYLRHLSLGGEKLAPMDPPSGYGFHNAYGPTECTILATIFKVEKKEENIPIGKSLENLKSYVVGANGRRVPPGALGELWIAGPHVGAGYLNRPEKTAEVFIENPFDGGAYAPVYRSGDLVRYRQDGNIEFIGRRDGQVKIHGFRIELSEVEAVLRSFPGVRDAAVTAFERESEGRFLAAYLVSDETVDLEALRQFILERKPPYMVPSAIMQIDKIPLNQNGKVARKSLPEPTATLTAEEDIRPANVLEEELLSIIGSCLGGAQAALGTKLAWIGLSSISAIRLQALLFKRFGVNIPSKELLDSTVVDIENVILKDLLSGGAKKGSSAAEEESGPVPLGPARQGVYFECLKQPESTAYNIPSVLRFAPSTDARKLSEAVLNIIKKHPSVLVHFELQEKETVAVPDDKLPEILVTSLTEEMCAEFEAEFVRPFRLDKGPLCRFAVVKVIGGDGNVKEILLFADFHHLVFDGMSMSIFLKCLSEELSGREAEPETASYASYVRSLAAEAENGGRESNEAYIAGLLADFESATELPADLAGRAEEGGSAFAEYPLDEALLSKACAELDVTEAGLMLAAADYAIARFAAADRVYLSTISSGRSDVRFMETFGMFVNTLPLAASLSDGTAGDFVKAVAKGFDEAIAHERYPFAEVAAKYGFMPNLMYEYQRGVVGGLAMPGLLGIRGLALSRPKFKIALRIEDRADGPVVSVEYNDALYSAAYMASFAKAVAAAAARFSTNAGEALRKVSLLDGDALKTLRAFHTSPYGEEKDPKAGELFQSGLERFAAEAPDRTALIAADRTLTFRELDEGANRIANALLARGASGGSRVAVLLPRTSRVILAIFGVLKAGCAYIPCDPSYPEERIRHILDDAEAPFVITTAERTEAFAGGTAAAVDVEELLAAGSAEKPEIDICPDDLAYLIYTSGSTGTPKGVMLRHRGAANYMAAAPANILAEAMVKEGHVITSVATLSFDMSIKELFLPLFNGLTVAFASEAQNNSPAELAKLMRASDTDMFNATPSRLMALMEDPEFLEALGNCRIIVCGAEGYPASLLQRLRSATKARIFNTYGPTEITVSSNAKELTEAARVSVGKPLLGVREYIVDTDGNELPQGVVGELYIGGTGVAAGYRNLPEKTAESFIDFTPTEGGSVRVYKSGDLARWTADGDVEILGRRDGQVKLRGLRIEIGEVESVLSAADGIRRAVVKVEKINGIDHLAAWFTADREIDVAALREEIGKKLTPYMVPTAYMQMDELPTTPNGKLDLRHLPAPALYRRRTAGAAEAVGETEKVFCGIFSQLLHLENVGPEESFFDLGGTSLLVTSLLIEARKHGYLFAYGDVFSHPTPRALAALLGQSGSGEEKKTDDELVNYDYAALEPVLAGNTLEAFRSGETRELGNILLAGATGYLGIHILHELLLKENGRIYCLLRSRGKTGAARRLLDMLFYYFERDYSAEIGKRILIVDGSVTSDGWFAEVPEGGIGTVINCAAIVKHFAEGTEIEDVNIGGAKTLIRFCLERGARFIQTSTMSTVDSAPADTPAAAHVATEQSLYFGQSLDNKYTRAKFLAERAVIEAIAKDGLRGKIMRLGNLAARYSDGEFQINFETNSAMGRLRAYAALGCCAYEQLDATMEFSPIDAVAEAIVALSKTPDACVLFHTINHQRMLMENIFAELGKVGLPVRAVEQEEFAAAFAKAQEDPAKAEILTSMMAYMAAPGKQRMVMLPRHNEFTMQVLYRLGFRWPVTTWDYVARFLESIMGLGYFD